MLLKLASRQQINLTSRVLSRIQSAVRMTSGAVCPTPTRGITLKTAVRSLTTPVTSRNASSHCRLHLSAKRLSTSPLGTQYRGTINSFGLVGSTPYQPLNFRDGLVVDRCS